VLPVLHSTANISNLYAPETGQITVELVVLRQVAFGLPLTDLLYGWLSGVAATACGERRNVRVRPSLYRLLSLTRYSQIQPTHPGTLVQVGWNAGPRHARVFGLAKSYTKILDPASMANHDEDAIAAMTLTWGVCKSLLPTEVMDEIERSLEREGLPRIATRNVADSEYKPAISLYLSTV
jgi:hypothetical protein